MTAQLMAAIDEATANTVFHEAETALGTTGTSGSSSFGPFSASYSASASFSGGTLTLMAPGTVSVDDLMINYSLGLTLSLDLSFLDFCLPRVCIPTPWGDICTPKICISFPTISVPLSFSSSALVSADFGIQVALDAGDWVVSIVVQQVRKVDIGTAATALVVAIGSAVSLALLAVPFIGPLLSLAAGIITAAFGVASVAGLLGDIVNLFAAGMTFEVVREPQVVVLPAGGPFDPPVPFTITALSADVESTDENELVVTAAL